MNPTAILALISDLYVQNATMAELGAAKDQRIAELEQQVSELGGEQTLDDAVRETLDVTSGRIPPEEAEARARRRQRRQEQREEPPTG